MRDHANYNFTEQVKNEYTKRVKPFHCSEFNQSEFVMKLKQFKNENRAGAEEASTRNESTKSTR